MTRLPEPQLETLTYQAEQLPDAEREAITRFHEAACVGFYDRVMDEAARERYRQIMIAQKLRFSLIYDRAAAPASRHAQAPVATYGSFAGTMNAGGPGPVAVHKISAVTVAPAYRRRGILSTQMRADLAWAARAGFPLAALTASEATIYGRYGFDVASRHASFTLGCAGGLKLRTRVPGTVVEVDPERFANSYRQVAARAFDATFGSVDGMYFDEGYALGRWDGWETLAGQPALRFAAYYDQSGQPDGFVAYKFNGWADSVPSLSVQKLLAAGPTARLALIEYLGNHDLVREVKASGPLDDPVRLALADERAYQSAAVNDVLWLRVLDVPAALAGRGYLHDGQITLTVEDGLGLASGTYLLSVHDRKAQVQRLDAQDQVPAHCPWVELDVRDLASLYLGGAGLDQLVQVGRAVPRNTVPLGTTATLFAAAQAPYTPHTF